MSRLESKTSDEGAKTVGTTQEDTPLVQQHEGSEDNDDAVSQHSRASTRAEHSGGDLTEDENPKAQNGGRRDTSAKRRRNTTLSDQQRLARLEKEWRLSTKKRGKFESHQPRSSPRRVLRSPEPFFPLG